MGRNYMESMERSNGYARAVVQVYPYGFIGLASSPYPIRIKSSNY